MMTTTLATTSTLLPTPPTTSQPTTIILLFSSTVDNDVPTTIKPTSYLNIGDPSFSPTQQPTKIPTTNIKDTPNARQNGSFFDSTIVLIMVLVVIVLCCFLCICCMKQLRKDKKRKQQENEKMLNNNQGITKGYGVNMLSHSIFVYIINNVSQRVTFCKQIDSELSKSQQNKARKPITFIEEEMEQDEDNKQGKVAKLSVASQSNTNTVNNISITSIDKMGQSVTLGNEIFVNNVHDPEVINEEENEYDVTTPKYEYKENKMNDDIVIDGEDDITPSENDDDDSDESVMNGIMTLVGNDENNVNNNNIHGNNYNINNNQQMNNNFNSAYLNDSESSDDLDDIINTNGKGETAW